MKSRKTWLLPCVLMGIICVSFNPHSAIRNPHSSAPAQGPSCSLAPSSATNPVGSSHTVTATVLGPAGGPVGGATVSFSVAGVNAASGSGTTNAAGQASFSYTSNGLPGMDTIDAGGSVPGVGSFSCSATKTWVQPCTCPSNITTSNAPGGCGAVVTYPPPTGDCAGVTCTPASGSFFNVGTTAVTCSLPSGAPVCTFTITVNDTEPPNLQCSDVTLPVNENCKASLNFMPAAALDNCTNPVNIVFSSNPPLPVMFGPGTQTVMITATDEAGNSTTCTTTVTVVDAMPPAIFCPANITTAATSAAGATVTFTATVTDNCPNPTVTCVPPSGSTFPLGTTTVTCTATDGSGNTSNCSFLVIVNRPGPPAGNGPITFNLPINPAQSCGCPQDGSPTTFTSPLGDCTLNPQPLPPGGGNFSGNFGGIFGNRFDVFGNRFDVFGNRFDVFGNRFDVFISGNLGNLTSGHLGNLTSFFGQPGSQQINPAIDIWVGPGPIQSDPGPNQLLQDSGPFSVYLHNGEFYLRDVDLEIPGRGFNYQFVRSYRNGVTFNGPLGHNWEFNYNRRLVIMGASVLRMDGFNRADEYTLNPDGSFKAPTGFYTNLVRTSDGGFVEREPSGTMIFYSAPDARGVAVMTRVTDRNGNTMRFVYNGQSQLIRVIDTLGRPIEYRYNEQGRLIEVSDFIGRTIRFEYDGNADLVAVTSPAVTGTPTRNDFPQGKTTRYSYSSGFDDETFNHNLLSITAPNEVASGGQARIRVEYETSPNSPSRDRVLRQTIGGTTAPAEFNNGQIRFRNDARVPAGGTISYEYRFLDTAPENDFITPVSQTTVTDRNGNRTEYQFNQLGNIVRIREFTNRDIRPSDPEFFETRYEYNQDGKLLRAILPQGNSAEYAYDDRNPDRYQQGNLLTATSRPDSQRGGDQTAIRVSRTYEPIYNQVRTLTEARGNDPSYAPLNGGANSADRYMTVYVYDYQEGMDFAGLARQLGVSENEVRRRLQGVPMGLGDVNGDGRTDQIAGNVVKVIRPTVNLLSDSRMSQVEGGTRQPIEVTFVYNSFGQLLARRDPEGNVTIYTYHPENDPDGDGRDLTPGLGSEPLGYLREVILDAMSSSERNSRTNPPPAEIHHSFFYDRVGNVIQEVDGRGIATRYAINQLNQVVQIIRAADVTEALRNPEEPNYGGCSDQTLIECRAGMVAFRYLTNLFYDFNNNLIRSEVENRDSNNQSLVGAFVESTFAYDILDDVVEQTQEVNSTASGSDRAVTTRYRYDRNQNQVLVISPAATSGQQPSNVVSYAYDERDLLFTSTRGGVTDQFRGLAAHADVPERTSIPSSRDISTSSRFYDPNRNLTQLIDGADNTGDGQPEATTYLYDGFDRRVSVIDAVGNQSFANYDPASNVVRVSNFGPVGGPTPTSNRAATFTQPLTLQSIRQPLLSQVEFKYDELGRSFERDDRLFVYNGVTYVRSPQLTDGPLGSANDGVVVTRYEYDRNSHRTFVIEDDLSTSQTLYDGVNRVIEQIDPEENRVQFVYDDDNNVVKTIQTDVTSRDAMTAGNVPDLTETFISINVYDSLNRLIRTTDNLGNTRRYQYDSRGNMIFQTEAQYSLDPADLIPDPLGLFPDPQSAIRNPQSAINRPGNTMAYFYDGLNRLLSEVCDGHVDGQGKHPIDRSNPANPDALVVMDYQWDANSRLVAMADDGSSANDQNTSIGVIEPSNPQGNVTRFRYDDLDRLKQEVFDDGSIRDYAYDADHNLVRLIDGNGSTIANTYDGINRLVRRDITRASSTTPHPAGGVKDPSVTWTVIGTTMQTVEYDGLSRPTRSFDNNEPDTPGDDATATFAYDSLSRPLEEVQNGQAISGRWAGDNNRLGLVYPNGRQLEFTFDKLDRITQIRNPQSNSAHAADRNPDVDYDYIGPARVLERMYSNGVRLTHLNDAGTADTGYDAMQRELQRRHLRADNVLVAGFEYGYDSEHHKLSERALHTNTQETYSYDSIHRLARVARQGQAPDTFQLDGANNWARRGNAANQTNTMNEYTRFGNATLSYDDNGNLLDDGTYRYEYDVANRLKRITRKSGNAVVGVYAYDAQGRRIARTVTNSGQLNEQVRYFYDGWAELEERRGTAVQQFVYSERLDDPLVLDRDQNGDGQTDERFFYHDDGRGHIVALTDERGQVVERTSYDAYGRPTFMNANGGTLNVRSSPAGNPFLFTGRRFDPEAELYYYRARSYHPTLGRFLQRDPMGMLGLEEMSYGNSYTYVGNNPIAWRDPLGLFTLIEQPGVDVQIGGGVFLPAIQLPHARWKGEAAAIGAIRTVATAQAMFRESDKESGIINPDGPGGSCSSSQSLGANPGLRPSLGSSSKLHLTCEDVFYWTFVKCLGVRRSESDLFDCTFNKDPECVKCHAVAWKAYLDCKYAPLDIGLQLP